MEPRDAVSVFDWGGTLSWRFFMEYMIWVWSCYVNKSLKEELLFMMESLLVYVIVDLAVLVID